MAMQSTRHILSLSALAASLALLGACGGAESTDTTEHTAQATERAHKGGTKPSPVPAPAPAPTPAQQAVQLTFDDFVAVPSGVPMPNSYGGFIWGERWWTMLDPATGNNYLAVGSGGSILIRRADGTPFYFDGADFWSRRGLDAVGDFYFVLYHQGKVVYNGLNVKKGKQVFTDTSARLTPDYAGPIDALAFAFDSNGTDWNHLAMDNFRFRVDLK